MHIITGMHRSGTSFISQAIHSLGGDFGDLDVLFPADLWNQNGYFENIDVIDVNNRLILGDGARIEYWLEAPAAAIPRIMNSLRSRKWKYFLFPGEAAIHGRCNNYSDRIQTLGEAYRSKFVKDPRFCLTLGVWNALTDIEGVVFSYRNPFAVAGSVRRRERLPTAFGLRYWSYHIRGFFTALPENLPVQFIDFDAFFDPARQSAEFARVARFMSKTPEAPEAQSLAETLDVKLRTHAPPLDTKPEFIVAMYEALQSLHRASEHGSVRLADHPRERAAILGHSAP